MMKRGILAVVLAIAILSIVPLVWAARTNIEVRLPVPALESFQLNGAGDITVATFDGGEDIVDPVVSMKDLTNIDFLGFQMSMQYDVVDFRTPGPVLFRCLKKYNSDCVKSNLVAYSKVLLDPEGNVTQLLDAQGQELNSEKFNLDDMSIENVSIESIRSYRVIDYRDRSSGETRQRIVQLSVLP